MDPDADVMCSRSSDEMLLVHNVASCSGLKRNSTIYE